MKIKFIHTLSTAALLCTSWSFSAFAGDSHHRNNVFKDSARVVHVEPKYRIITRHIPQRTCDVPRRHNHHRRHVQERHHTRQHNPGAVFISGVIGGAIGHELTRSVNGKSHPGAVIAGAAIGAGLAASHQRHHQPSNKHVYTEPRRQHNSHRQHRNTHCTTTTHVKRIRKPDGYLVTYRYRGHTYRTHTDHHPGDRIKVKVAISAGH